MGRSISVIIAAYNARSTLEKCLQAQVQRAPTDLTGLATAKFPDGSTPEVIDVVRVAANLFAAGQETTVRLLGSALLTRFFDLKWARRERDSRVVRFSRSGEAAFEAFLGS